MATTWHAHNYSHPIPDLTRPFTIACPKGTDIYDKPPSTHRFDAPVIYTSTTVSAFESAAITISADWTHKYDQGGLCLIIKLKEGTRKWLKVGIEYLDGTPWISVVVKDRWADWGLRPLLHPESRAGRVLIENDKQGNLWVYVVDENGKREPVREVTWWGELDGDIEVQIGPAAAKPSDEGGDLVVSFGDFVLSTVCRQIV